jgi:DNA (cytosine-5)-methyltransferase 1
MDSFHTPNTTGLDGGSNSRKALKKRMEKWPTPATKGYGHAAEGMVGNLIEKIEQGVITKLEAEQMLSLPKLENHRTWTKKFPTPQASDNRDRGNMSNAVVQRRIAIGKQILLSQSVSPTSGQLNPTWVEWLMGWPLEWTDLKRLEMDKFLCVQQQPGEC